jgi:hypothetical protein
MAQEIDINLNVNTEQADKSLGSLKSQLRQAQAEVGALADKFGATSKEAVEAAKRAADLKDRIGDAKSLTDAFNPDAKFKALSASLTGVAGGFSVVTGAMGAFGGQSKAVEESLLKVQSAMAMASGLQAIGESVDSFKQLGAVVKSYSIVQKAITAGQWLWNAAMAANPLGAIVAAIAAVIAAGYLLIKMFMDSAKANEDAIAATKRNTRALEQNAEATKKAKESLKENNDQQYALAKASGASAEELRKLNLKHAEEAVALNYSSAVLASNTFKRERATLAMLKQAGASDEAIEAQQKLTEASYKEFEAQNEALKESYKERRKVINQNEVEIVQERTDATKKANEDAKTKREEAQKKELDSIKEANAKKLAEEKRLADERRKLFEDSIKKAFDLEKELNESVETPAEKENREYLEKKKILEDNYLSTEILDKQHKDNLLKIEQDYWATEADNAKLRDEEKKIKDDQIAAYDAEREKLKNEVIANSKENLSNIIQGLEASGLAKTKAGQAIAKTLALTQIAIDSAVAISKASTLANAEGAAAQLAFPTVPGAGTIARVVSYASTVLSVVSNIARAKALLSGGGGGGGGSASGGGGGGSASAPSFNVVGQSGANQVAQSIGGQMQQPLQAFVVGQDVTTQQGLNRGIVQNATLG